MLYILLPSQLSFKLFWFVMQLRIKEKSYQGFLEKSQGFDNYLSLYSAVALIEIVSGNVSFLSCTEVRTKCYINKIFKLMPQS